MASTGFDRRTGKLITGWDRVRQAIEVIVTTELASRVERRQFGSPVPSLIDRPQNIDTVVDLYMGIAEAVEFRLDDGAFLGEPCFRLTNISIVPSPTGRGQVAVDGQYFPNGHRGDYSVVENKAGILITI